MEEVAGGEAFVMGSIVNDVRKAVNHLPRRHFQALARHVGLPNTFIKAWRDLLATFSAAVKQWRSAFRCVGMTLEGEACTGAKLQMPLLQYASLLLTTWIKSPAASGTCLAPSSPSLPSSIPARYLQGENIRLGIALQRPSNSPAQILCSKGTLAAS